jgi:hypothetical protein
MNKFIDVTASGKVLSVNVNHIVAIEPNGNGSYLYFSSPLNSTAVRETKESREEILSRINK